MTLNLKYAKVKGNPVGTPGRGRKVNPDTWCTGPDPVVRDKYYAWMRHKSQSRYRGESHSLTFEQWQSLWTNENWAKRGRKIEDLCIARLDWSDGWHDHNVAIMTRKQHFKMRYPGNDE